VVPIEHGQVLVMRTGGVRMRMPGCLVISSGFELAPWLTVINKTAASNVPICTQSVRCCVIARHQVRSFLRVV
jgi:hypothetical protein